jgi:hypothetical protein
MQQESPAQPLPCDGADRHNLGVSAKSKAIFGAVAVLFLALIIASRQFAHFGAWGVGLLVAALLTASYRVSLDGPDVVLSRAGAKKAVPLDSVVRVERYRYRGATSLRMWKADGKRAPSIPVSARFYRLDPAAASHLLRYLDRRDVRWGPGAWELLSAGSPPRPAPGAPGFPATTPAEPSQPQGIEVPAKPPSRWARVGVWMCFASLGIGSLVLLVVAPVTWSQYIESQRIQHGPQALAVLQREWITAYSDRYGTHHTTHFDVAFDTTGQQLIVTEIHAPGSWTMEPAGDRLVVRYDPSAPQHAELPGAPEHSIVAAITTTVVGALCAVMFGAMVYVMRRARIRRRQAP